MKFNTSETEAPESSGAAGDDDDGHLENGNGNGNGKRGRSAKQRPTKTLPTDRISQPKQTEIVRAFGAASGADRRTVTTEDVGKIVGFAGTTLNMGTAFWVDCGLISKAEGGFTAASEVVEFCRCHDFSPAVSAHKLAPLFLKCWFGQRIVQRLAFRPLSVDEAISELADEASAGIDRRIQLEMIIGFLEVSGVIVRDGMTIRKGPAATASGSTVSQPAAEHVADHKPPDTNRPRVESAQAPTVNHAGIAFQVNVNVDMAELSAWTPEQMVAFFSGVAQVLNAKKGIEVLKKE